MGAADQLNGTQQGREVYTACLRCTGTGKVCRIQAIEINGEIYGCARFYERLNDLFQSLKRKFVHIRMSGCKFKFFAVATADAKLMNASISYQIMATA